MEKDSLDVSKLPQECMDKQWELKTFLMQPMEVKAFCALTVAILREF